MSDLRSLFASGNHLQMYDHRQNRWLSPDEAVAALRSTDVPSVTPLQREVAVPPTCAGCERGISVLGDLYRCAQCRAAFHLTCIYEHFGWSVNGPPDAERESHRRADPCLYPPCGQDALHTTPNDWMAQDARDGGHSDR